MDPSPTDPNGRTASGRFDKKNNFAAGNPHQQKVQKFRSVLLNAVTLADMRAVVKKLVAMAKDGDLGAMKLLLDRSLGKIAVDQVEPPVSAKDRHRQLVAIADRIRDERRQADAAEISAVGQPPWRADDGRAMPLDEARLAFRSRTHCFASVPADASLEAKKTEARERIMRLAERMGVPR